MQDTYPVTLTPEQKSALRKLWWIYGNGGPKSTKGNHSFIQGLIEYNENRKTFYVNGIQNMRDNGVPESKIGSLAITQECIDEVEKILNNPPAAL